MLSQAAPRRKSKWLRALLRTLVLLPVAALVLVLVWKWETLDCLLHMDEIRVKSRTEAMAALREDRWDEYRINTLTEQSADYYAWDGQIRIRVAYAGETLESLSVVTNYNRLSVSTPYEVIPKAEMLLEPFLTMPETEALVLYLVTELPKHVQHSELNFNGELIGYRLSIETGMESGMVRVKLGTGTEA